MVGNHRAQETVDLLVVDLEKALVHGVADDALPYVVVDLVQVFNEGRLVKTLVPTFVLDHRYEIVCMQNHREKRVGHVPLTLVLCYCDIPIQVVLLLENPFVDVAQIVQVPYLSPVLHVFFLFLVDLSFVKLKNHRLRTENQSNYARFRGDRLNSGLKFDLEVDVFANESFALLLSRSRVLEPLEIAALCRVTVECNQINV